MGTLAAWGAKVGWARPVATSKDPARAGKRSRSARRFSLGHPQVGAVQRVVKIADQKHTVELAQMRHTLFLQIGPRKVLFQRCIEDTENHQAQNDVNAHIAAVVDQRVEGGVIKHRAEDLRRGHNLINGNTADVVDDEPGRATQDAAPVAAARLAFA